MLVGFLVGFILVAAILWPSAMTPADPDATEQEVERAGGCVNAFLLFVVVLVVAAVVVNVALFGSVLGGGQ